MKQMAQDGVMALEAIPHDLQLKCHPEKAAGIVCCILCDSAFHRSDFNRKKYVRYLTNVLVICDEHKDVNLTSIMEKDKNNARLVVANLKYQIQQKDDEFAKLVEKFELLETLNSKLIEKK